MYEGLIIFIIFVFIVFFIFLCYILYMKYSYISIIDKDERHLKKKFMFKYDRWTKKEINSREFAEWMFKEQKVKLKINRRKKLEKLNKINENELKK